MNLAIHRKLLLLNKANKSLLPREYQQVEYIEGTGTQIIDTGVALQNYPSFTGSFKYTTDSTYTVLGVQNGKAKAYIRSSGAVWGTHNQPTGYYGNAYGGPHYVKMSDWHTFEFGSGYFNVDGASKTFYANFYSTTSTIALFGYNNAGTFEPSAIAIGEIKIYTGQAKYYEKKYQDYLMCYFSLCSNFCYCIRNTFKLLF
jgi:hypothetical protein